MLSGVPTQPIIVVTDLDGTLLDHYSYSAAAATAALRRLQQHRIPVIFNTSKTSAEVVELRHQLDNHEAYVCENGSAIYIAQQHPDDNQQTEPYWKPEILGVPYQVILSCLNQLRQQGFKFRGFNDMTTTEVAALTGLDTVAAERSKQRHASEPLVWNDSDNNRQLFQQQLANSQLQMVKGGRFWHVMGRTDKANGVSFLRQYYKQKWQVEPTVIALGDGQNDLAMLKAADYPVVIPGQNETLKLDHKNTMIAQAHGPDGWNQAINHLLDQLI